MSAPELELFIVGDEETRFRALNQSSDNTGLRPCPFCGKTNGLEVENHWSPVYTVNCSECGTEGPHGDPLQPYEEPVRDKILLRRLHQQAHSDAVERWNRRVA